MADYFWMVIALALFFIALTVVGLFLSKGRLTIKKGSSNNELITIKNTINSIKTLLKIPAEPVNYDINPSGIKAKVYRPKKKIDLLLEISSDLRLILNKLQDKSLNLTTQGEEKLDDNFRAADIHKDENNSNTPQNIEPNTYNSYNYLDKNTSDFESNVDSSAFNTHSSSTQIREQSEEGYRRIDVNQSLSPTDEFISQYNQACIDRGQRQLFWENYKNFIYFGNKNAAAQARGENTNFDFRTKDGGDFIAVKLLNDDRYFVVPRFDTTINNTTYKEGGFGAVFECLNYQPDYSYSSIKVEEPAVFKQNGDQWTLINPGKMLLQA